MRTTDPSDRLADSLFSSLFPVSAIWSAICMIGSRVRRSPSPLGTPLSSSSENQRRDSNACRKRKSQSTQFCRRSKRIWSRCESWARVDYSRLFFFPTDQFISREWAVGSREWAVGSREWAGLATGYVCRGGGGASKKLQHIFITNLC